MKEIILNVESKKEIYSPYDISSFGVGLAYLLSENLIDNNSTATLDIIDNVVLKQNIKTFSELKTKPYNQIFLPGIYLLLRMEIANKKVKQKFYDSFISDVYKFYSQIDTYQNTELLLSQSFSVLFVLLSLKNKYANENLKIDSVIQKILEMIENNKHSINNINNLYALLAILELLPDYTDLYSRMKKLLTNINTDIELMKWSENVWFDIIYRHKTLNKYKKSDVLKYIDNKILNSYYEQDCVSSIFSAIGLSYLFNYYKE